MHDDLYQNVKPSVPKEWPDSYYDVEDIQLRQQLLDEHLGRTEATPQEIEADRFREKLFLSRYEKKNGKYIDRYIANLFHMCILTEQLPGMFGKKGVRKEVQDALEVLCPGIDADSEMERELYYRELKHAIRVYIVICKRDRQYGSVILGLGKKKSPKILSKIVHDFKKITTLLPEKLQLEEDSRRKISYLKEAIAEAFYEEEPTQDQWYQYLQN